MLQAKGVRFTVGGGSALGVELTLLLKCKEGTFGIVSKAADGSSPCTKCFSSNHK